MHLSVNFVHDQCITRVITIEPRPANSHVKATAWVNYSSCHTRIGDNHVYVAVELSGDIYNWSPVVIYGMRYTNTQ